MKIWANLWMKISTSNQDHHPYRQWPQATNGRGPNHLQDKHDPGYRPIPDRLTTRCIEAKYTTSIQLEAAAFDLTHIDVNNVNEHRLHGDRHMNA